MSTKTPWFPLWAADWLTDTSGMSVATRGIYIHLLCYQWINGHIPTDPVQRARICGCSLKEMDEAWLDGLLGKFTGTEKDERLGRIYNPRLLKEREITDRLTEQKRAAGRASAAARRKKAGNSGTKNTSTNAADFPFPTDDEREGNHSQSQSQLQLGGEGAAPRPRAKRKHMLPEDWQPSRRLLDWAKKETPAVDVKAETLIFRDTFLSSGNPKIDWDRTWMVWMRKEQRGAAKKKRRFTRADADRVGKRENKIKHSGETWESFTDRMQTLDEGHV